MKMRSFSLLTVTALLIGALPAIHALAADPVAVVKQPPSIKHRTSAPPHPPPEMPQPAAGESAVTTPSFAMNAQANIRITGAPGGAKIMRIESIRATPSLTITLWLPENASKALKEHEEGHR